MGILNVTPDSFYDGGRLETLDDVIARAEELVSAGADLLDIGGESTRPGSARVSVEEEVSRVIPAVREVVRRVRVPVSVDTYKADVARRALDVGCAMINDVTALRGDPEMVRVVSRSGAPVVLMHALWPPEVMQVGPEYGDVVQEVAAFLDERVRFAVAQGVSRDRVIVDPGIGFGKTLAHNLALLRSVSDLLPMAGAVLVGPSNKRFLGDLLGRETKDRQWGTAAVVALLAASGVNIIRVHDVGVMKDVVRLVDAVVWQV
jgi:dihydropteroate synthase